MLASKGCTQARDENNGMLAVHLASEGCTQADEKREQWDAGSPPGRRRAARRPTRDENNGMLAVHLASKGCTQAVDENFLALDSGSRVASRCCFLMGK